MSSNYGFETDSALIDAAGGDEAAFERIFSAFEPVLRSQFRARRDRCMQRRYDSSDVVQETRIAVYQRLPSFVKRRPMPFLRWLEFTARQIAIDLWRYHYGSAKRSVIREVYAEEFSSNCTAAAVGGQNDCLVEVAERDELFAALRAAINRLNEASREILRLRYLDGRTNAEVARFLEISESAASKRHGAALRQLRKSLLTRKATENVETPSPL
ncbi:MAG: sigma-70 family RNA polymerase sigma factor [Pirellulaceae bacterium]|nr:sigma-70 family RNA polymerase sigma factor [Planctomycetales bacterium]